MFLCCIRKRNDRTDLNPSQGPCLGEWISSTSAGLVCEFHPWIIVHRSLEVPTSFHHSFPLLRSLSSTLHPSAFRKTIVLPSWEEFRTTGQLLWCETWPALRNEVHGRCMCNIFGGNLARSFVICGARFWEWCLRRLVRERLRQFLERRHRSRICACVSCRNRSQATFPGLGFFHAHTTRGWRQSPHGFDASLHLDKTISAETFSESGVRRIGMKQNFD